MKPIKTRLHGLLDYGIAFILMLPYISNYRVHEQDTLVLSVTGIVVGLYSLVTDYEFGLLKFIPMKTHLLFDVMVGIFLLGLPFVLPVQHYYLYWPVLLGIVQLITVVLSSTTPYKITHRDLDITKPA